MDTGKSQKSILIIDDEEIIRQSFCDQLEDFGYHVMTADNGQAGIELIQSKRPDLVLTDLIMPGMDGLEIITRTKEISPNTPIIVISGAGRVEAAVEAIRLGAYDYLTKPIYDFNLLQHTISSALENADLQQEVYAHREKLEDMVDKRTQELAAQKRLLELSLNSIAEGFVVWDENERLVVCNNNFYEYFGIPQEALVPGTYLLDLIRYRAKAGYYGEGDPEKQAQKRYQEIVPEREPRERRQITNSGRILDVKQFPIEGLGRISTFADVTQSVKREEQIQKQIIERERAEKELAEQSHLFELALNSIDQGFIVMDEHEQLVVCNNRFCDLFGIQPDTLAPGTLLIDLIRFIAKAGYYGDGDPEKLAQKRYQEVLIEKEQNELQKISNSGQGLYVKQNFIEGLGQITTFTDITDILKREELLKQQILDRELAERELAAQSQLLELTLNSIDQGIIVMDEHEHLVVCNNRFCKLFGLPAGALPPGTSLFNLILIIAKAGHYGEADPEILAQKRYQEVLIERDHQERTQSQFDTNSGLAFYVQQYTVKGLGKITTYTDITDSVQREEQLNIQIIDRKQAEKELAEQSQLFELALNSIDQGFIVWDENLRLVVCNNRYYELFGISPDDAGPGTSLLDLVRVISRTGFYGDGDPEKLAQSRYQDILLERDQHKQQHITNSGRVLDVCRYPIKGLGKITTYTDITDILEREKAAQMLREAIETFSDSVILFNKKEEVIFTNNRYHEVFPNSPPKEKITDSSTLTSVIRATLEAGQLDHPLAQSDPEAWLAKRLAEWRGTKEASGEIAHTNGLSYSYKLSQSSIGGHIHVLTDITERKRADDALVRSEEQLKSQVGELRENEERMEAQAAELVSLAENLSVAHDEMKKLNNQKDKFFSIIAHDLKSPFTALLGFSSLLSDQGASLAPDKAAEYGSMVHQSAEQVFKLLENLLEWSLLQMGRMEFAPGPVDLKEVIGSNVTLFQAVASHKKINLTNNLKGDSPLTVLADFHMVDTIVRNLVNNAVKFTPDQGEVTISARRNGDWIELEVSDTGVGISKQRMGRLFRLDEYSTTKGTKGETGTGLGLHLCKDLVERQGGKIQVESSKDKGTKFSITLPLYTAEASEEVIKEPSQIKVN